jgi:hypothetical protein
MQLPGSCNVPGTGQRVRTDTTGDALSSTVTQQSTTNAHTIGALLVSVVAVALAAERGCCDSRGRVYAGPFGT